MGHNRAGDKARLKLRRRRREDARLAARDNPPTAKTPAPKPAAPEPVKTT